MKILMFSADPNILDVSSAAAGRMIEYGKRIEKLDILVLIPDLDVGRPSGVGLAENTKAYALTGRFSRFLKAFFKAWQMLKKEKYDLLVAQDIEHAVICWILSFFFNIKWQIQIHTDIFSPYFIKHSVFNILRAWLTKFLIPRASCIRVVSERIKRSVLQLRMSDIRTDDVRHPCVDVLPILAEHVNLNIEPKHFPGFDKTILMVSRLTSEKNIGLAIDAMAEVVKKHPKTGLVIVGDGPEREALKLKTKNYKLQTNVRFEGWQKDTAPYYKSADIFLLTSWYEGWGMSAVEAMQYGAAVIMTDVGLAGEVIEDGNSGLVIPVGDKNALVGAILRLLENDVLRRNLIESAAKKVKELPSAEEYYQRMVDSWQKCSGPAI